MLLCVSLRVSAETRRLTQRKHPFVAISSRRAYGAAAWFEFAFFPLSTIA